MSPPGHSRLSPLAPKTPSPSTAQNVPKVESSRPTANLIVFSGTRASGLCSAMPATSTIAPPSGAPRRRRLGIESAFSPNVITMKITSRPSRKTPLKLTTNPNQSSP